VDRQHIAVTGHSRGGKAALLAGALDERIALTAPNASGCGGAGCYRVLGEKSEDIAAITNRFSYWFHPRLKEFVSHVDQLPFDQHSLKALVAPRAQLSTEGLDDLWANPYGTQVSFVAARKVYEFLGAAGKIGIHFREGKHAHTAEDWQALLDFADLQFFGKNTETRFDKLPFAVASTPQE
jgi:acetyl esterase/lipase